MPCGLMKGVLVLWLTGLAIMYGYISPTHDPQFAAMVRLLQWRDPVSGNRLLLAINRNTPLVEQANQLKQLEALNLNLNELTVIPPEMAELPRLRTLALDFNRIDELPPQIGKLSNLRHLNVSSNQLTELPPTCANCFCRTIYTKFG